MAPMVEFAEIAKLIAIVVGPAGAAWWGVKTTLNGTVARVERIEKTVDSISHDMADVRERTARLEGQILK